MMCTTREVCEAENAKYQVNTVCRSSEVPESVTKYALRDLIWILGLIRHHQLACFTDVANALFR